MTTKTKFSCKWSNETTEDIQCWTKTFSAFISSETFNISWIDFSQFFAFPSVERIEITLQNRQSLCWWIEWQSNRMRDRNVIHPLFFMLYLDSSSFVSIAVILQNIISIPDETLSSFFFSSHRWKWALNGGRAYRFKTQVVCIVWL